MQIIPNFTPFDFQSKSIIDGISIIEKYNGLFIMDETGLGKTVVSSHIVLNCVKSVLVVSPKPNKEDWDNILSFTDLVFETSTVQSIHKIQLKEFDAIIVDEAHRYGNPNSKGFQDIFQLIYSQTKTPKVLLLSATPINNKIIELKTILSLIPFPVNPIPFLLLGRLFYRAEEAEKLIINNERFNNGYFDPKMFKKEMNGLNFTSIVEEIGSVCALFSIRNERKNINANDEKSMGYFPQIKKSDIEVEINNDLVWKTSGLLSSAKMALQNVICYCDETQIGLGFIYKTFLFKRLESSTLAFKNSISKNILKIEEALSNKNDSIIINDIEYELKNPDLFFSDLEKDLEIFKKVKALWLDETDENKLSQLISNIQGKTIIFTEFKDTLFEIEEFFKKNKIKFISYHGGDNDEKLIKIKQNFDANSLTQNDTFDVLLCTDALSEGISLHKSTTLIHFDNKWNPSRQIQREGRINRIIKNGQKKEIEIKNYKVPHMIEEIIKLEDKIDRKKELAYYFLKLKKKDFTINYPDFEPNTTNYFLLSGKDNYVFYIVKSNDGMIAFNKNSVRDALKNNYKISFHFPNGTFDYKCYKNNKTISELLFVKENNYLASFRSVIEDNKSYKNIFLNYLYEKALECVLKTLHKKDLKETIKFLNSTIKHFKGEVEICELNFLTTDALADSKKWNIAV